MDELTHLSLFGGIGGLDLAAERAGFRTVGQCEWADYPTKVLEKHWPDVPRWRDIRTLTGGDFYERTGLRTVDVISGGFPCQPFSVAGKRRGKEDDRYLWPEMLRVIDQIRPAWVVGENVAGIINMALDQVLSDLETIGYACQTFVIPACAVDASHRRDRCAIVANADGGPMRNDSYNRREAVGKINTLVNAGIPCRETVDNTNSIGLPRDERRREFEESSDGCWWPAEPDVGRVANGVPKRVDRLKCLGNAVVPAQFYPIFQAIADMEKLQKGGT